MQYLALFIYVASFSNVQGITQLRNKQKNESNTLERTKWRNKRKQVWKTYQHYDLTEENRKSQINPILLQQLLNNGISLQLCLKD